VSDPFSPARVGAAYDAAADDYVAAFGSDLNDLAVDRAVLDDAARRLGGRRVLEVGCGPGQVGAYVRHRGVATVFGIDASVRMLSRAPFAGAAGDMRTLPLRPASVDGVIAFYCVQHVRREELGSVLAEFARVLTSGGLVVLATHLGDGEVFPDELLGHRFEPFGGTFYRPEELRTALTTNAFEIVDERERGPLPHEHQSRRIYLTATSASA
jgi:SAM-dependent methyltransferase